MKAEMRADVDYRIAGLDPSAIVLGQYLLVIELDNAETHQIADLAQPCLNIRTSHRTPLMHCTS
ncbi:hypothetical protein AQ477_17820 (plasmid) [Burkholderia thailandensis]|nr:hypothetical protein AQ477_17820 [Burkholderia thailandensis]